MGPWYPRISQFGVGGRYTASCELADAHNSARLNCAMVSFCGAQRNGHNVTNSGTGVADEDEGAPKGRATTTHGSASTRARQARRLAVARAQNNTTKNKPRNTMQ